MPRAPNPHKKKARKLYMDGLSPAQIAKKLGISDGMVRRWKKEDNWDGGRSESGDETNEKNDKESNETNAKQKSVRKPGAPKGNKNAVGNHGGAPRGNQNHLIHGIYAVALPDDVKQLLEQREECSEVQQLEDMIKFWESRELLILREIDRYRNMPTGLVAQSATKAGQKTSTTAVSTFERIAYWESQLTSVQRAHMRCIETLHRIKQTEGGQGNENMDALMQSIDTARERWGEIDD